MGWGKERVAKLNRLLRVNCVFMGKCDAFAHFPVIGQMMRYCTDEVDGKCVRNCSMECVCRKREVN